MASVDMISAPFRGPWGHGRLLGFVRVMPLPSERPRACCVISCTRGVGELYEESVAFSGRKRALYGGAGAVSGSGGGLSGRSIALSGPTGAFSGPSGALYGASGAFYGASGAFYGASGA